MVGITEISAMVAAAGVLVGVVYYVLDIRHQNEVRQTDLLNAVPEEFRKDLADLVNTKEFRDIEYEMVNAVCHKCGFKWRAYLENWLKSICPKCGAYEIGAEKRARKG